MSSFPFKFLIHRERRFVAARHIAYDVAWHIFYQRSKNPDALDFLNVNAMNIIPYVILLGHFFEQFRANLAELLRNNPSLLRDLERNILGESKHEHTIQLERDILQRSSSSKAYRRLYILFLGLCRDFFSSLRMTK